MDSISLRSLHFQLLVRKQLRFLPNPAIYNPRISFSLPFPPGINRHRRHSRPLVFAVSSTTTREEEKKKMKVKPKTGHGKVGLNVCLDYQVEFGEHVAILGSTKELGSWKKQVPMNWTEGGWVCDLELKGGKSVEFKFVIVGKDKSVVWEGGDNRVLKLSKGGSFGVVCHWNSTGEIVEILPISSEEYGDRVEDDGHNESTADALVVETSPFVGQWQGRPASFMQSNKHQNREVERKWDTTGLEGLALKLVEGDKSARNWWRNVQMVIMLIEISYLWKLLLRCHNQYIFHPTIDASD